MQHLQQSFQTPAAPQTAIGSKAGDVQQYVGDFRGGVIDGGKAHILQSTPGIPACGGYSHRINQHGFQKHPSFFTRI